MPTPRAVRRRGQQGAPRPRRRRQRPTSEIAQLVRVLVALATVLTPAVLARVPAVPAAEQLQASADASGTPVLAAVEPPAETCACWPADLWASDDPNESKPMPRGGLSWQASAPCAGREVVIEGKCWAKLEGKPPCGRGPVYERDGKCYMAMPQERPSSSIPRAFDSWR